MGLFGTATLVGPLWDVSGDVGWPGPGPPRTNGPRIPDAEIPKYLTSISTKYVA